MQFPMILALSQFMLLHLLGITLPFLVPLASYCFQESFMNALQSLQDALQDEGYFLVNFLLYAYLEYIGGVTN